MDEKTIKLSNNTNPTVTYDSVNWEQRRWDAAKAVLPHLVSGHPVKDATLAVMYADELIKCFYKK